MPAHLDVVALLLRLEEVEGGALGDVQDGLELELALDAEVLAREVVLPVVGERLVERRVFLLRDVRRVARPEGLGLVELLLLGRRLLDLLGLLLRGSVESKAAARAFLSSSSTSSILGLPSSSSSSAASESSSTSRSTSLVSTSWIG